MLVVERGWHAQPVLVPLREGLALVGILDGDWAAADARAQLKRLRAGDGVTAARAAAQRLRRDGRD